MAQDVSLHFAERSVEAPEFGGGCIGGCVVPLLNADRCGQVTI